MNEKIKRLKKWYDSLKSGSERTNWESHCEELANVIIPKKQGFVGDVTPGEKRAQSLMNSTGVWANEMLAAGLHGFATNPAAKWFGLSMVDPRMNDAPAVKDYLHDVAEIMRAKMYAPDTNLITALHEIYLDLGCFGMAALYVDYDERGNHLKFESRPMSRLVVAESNKGMIDVVFRCFEWTVRQVIQEWGYNAVSGETQKKAQAGKTDEKVKIIHAIYPRTEFDITKGDASPENMAFASCYFEHGQEHLLEEGGYPENPYAIARWSRVSGEVYGRGPGMTALPDLKMLQAKEKTIIKAGQKAVDPNYFVRNDGYINPMRLIPGGITHVRGNPKDFIMPMPFSGNLPYAVEDIKALETRIMNTFHVDQLQFVNDAKMTATEVMQRTQERMRLLGPMLGRLESELLGPLIARVYGLLDRLGELPPPPQEIIDQDFTVQYVSPIAQAQKAVEIDTFRQFVAGLEVYLQAPETAAGFFKAYPVENVAAHFAKLLNIDPDMGADSEQIDQAAKMEQAQMMMQAAQPALHGAQAVNQLSQAGNQLTQASANLPPALEGAGAGMEAMQGIDPSAINQIMQTLNTEGVLPQ